MNFIDAILNLAVVLLWLQWRSLRTAQPPLPSKSLLSLLQPTDKPLVAARMLVFLMLLLLLRALFYWQIGAPLQWVPNLPFGPVTVPFRSDYFGLMMLYSVLAGAHAILVLFFWLLLLSVVNRRVPDSEPFQHWVRLHLGRTENFPALVKLFLPVMLVALAWLALHPLFVSLKLIPGTNSFTRLALESLVVGAGSWLAWKLLVLSVLFLHVVHSYIHLGAHPFWSFIEATGRSLLRPLAGLPLRIGRFDFAPFLLFALVWLAAWLLMETKYLDAGLPRLLRQLPP